MRDGHSLSHTPKLRHGYFRSAVSYSLPRFFESGDPQNVHGELAELSLGESLGSPIGVSVRARVRLRG